MARPLIRHILTMVDGTESSIAAAEYAIQFARAFKANLTAVAIVDTATLKHLLSTKILVAAEMEEYEREQFVIMKMAKRHL